MVHHGGRREPAEVATPCRWNILALLGKSFDMRLIDDGVFPRDRGPAFLAPGKRFVDDDGFRHSARVVATIERQVVARAAGAIAEMGIAPHQPTGELLRVGIEQQLIGVEAKPALRLIWAVARDNHKVGPGQRR